ncbi:MAG: hypothetical protein QW153_04005 [Candidatus Bilamarchaeaceae archaeon]
MKSNSLKGQAAMEYLMTYGLALFVIVIVLALLAFFLPSLIKTPATCIFSQQGLSCSKHLIVFDKTAGGNKVVFSLENNLGQTINLEKVACTNVGSGEITKELITKIGAGIPDEQKPMTSGTSKEFFVPCKDKNGNLLSNGPNTDFKGYIAVTYKYADDLAGAPSRIAIATITGQVVESD